MEHILELTKLSALHPNPLPHTNPTPTPRPLLTTHILLVLKKIDPDINGILIDILNCLSKCSFLTYYYTDSEHLSNAILKYPLSTHFLYDMMDHEERIDYVITVGGDGTILYGNKLFQKKITPDFISFEKGTLGFLCKFQLKDVQKVCEQLIEATLLGRKMECRTEARMRLTCTKLSQQGKIEERYECLNEIVINKADLQSQLRLDIYIADQLFTTTAGDGILISTPTGSTAYALSAGGPIIHTEVRTILIVPICPKSLSFRPICLPAYVNIKICISNCCKVNGYVSCDGQLNYELMQGEQLNISESIFDLISLSPLGEKNFSQWSKKLNNLLTWNAGFGGSQHDSGMDECPPEDSGFL